MGVLARNTTGGLRVKPGDPEGSFLYRKLTNALTGAEGESMPDNLPLLSQEKTDLVKPWIEAGANP